MGLTSLMWDRAVLLGKSSFKWVNVSLCGTEWSHVGQSHVDQVQYNSPEFYKSWNVLQASKYFSMIFKSLLDCQKVQDNLLEV